MKRAFQIGGLWLLAISVSLGRGPQPAAKNKPPAPPKTKPAGPPAHPAAAKPPQPKGGASNGAPKAPPKGEVRLVNPGNVATRLFHMTPEERDRALEKLPPEAQENARKTLAWFDALPKDQQANQLSRLERVTQLPPERKAEVRQLVVAANQLPPPRRSAVGQALLRLQEMNDEQREATLHRPAFQNRFSPEEFRIITGLADAWMGPQ
jgi:hypothetical protein